MRGPFGSVVLVFAGVALASLVTLAGGHARSMQPRAAPSSSAPSPATSLRAASSPPPPSSAVVSPAASERSAAPPVTSMTAHHPPIGGVSFSSAETCRPCHPQIYDEWHASPMARTVDLAGWSLRSSLAVLRSTGEAETMRTLCYACHAPFAREHGSLDLETPPLHEGVSCDFCHSVRDLEVAPTLNVASAVPGTVKTGPHADARSTGHDTLALPLMRRSEFCAGCHWFAWPESEMPIDWTYRQWFESPYRAEGVQCQDCHMPRRPGRASVVASAPDRGGVAAHTFYGARHLPTLRGALALRARRDRDTAIVEIENVGAGHSIPGGGGELRELELRVTPANGAPIRRRYGVRYFDEDGERVSGSDDGAVRFEDRTIKARETRVERIRLPAATAATVELWFWYVSEEVAERDDATAESVLVTSTTLPPVAAQ